MKNENEFKDRLDKELSAVAFHGQEAVMERVHASAPQRKRGRLTLALALVFVLICSTALAIAIAVSPAYRAESEARRIVSARYSLTSEMLDLFFAKSERYDGGWRVVFSPVSLSTEKLGVYKAVIADDGKHEASWSHDGADLRQGSLSADAWGSMQLEKVLEARKQNYEKWFGGALAVYEQLSLEDKAKLDSGLIMQDGSAMSVVNIAPTGGDISPYDAENAALRAVMEKYGIGADLLKKTSVSFLYYDSESAANMLGLAENARIYRFDFKVVGSSADVFVMLSSPSGDIAQCIKRSEPEDNRLPDGDLALYSEAAREWAESGAFDYLSADEKAETVSRFEAAGMRSLLPDGDFLASADLLIGEQEAIVAAKTAFEANYELHGNALQLFTLTTAVMNADSGSKWVVTLKYDEQWRAEELPHLPLERLGTYSCAVSAQSGEVISCAWSFDGYVLSDRLGLSTGWGGAQIGKLLAFADEYSAILAPYREKEPDAPWNIGELSVEDDAKVCALLVAEGFSARQYRYVLPEKGDLSYDAAVSLAISDIAETYSSANLSELNVNEYMTDCYIRYQDSEAPLRCWGVSVESETDKYTVVIGAEDGLVLGVWHDAAYMGNG